MAKHTPSSRQTTSLTLEQTLWKAADALRGNLDASAYKSVVLGIVFLKYISDAFDEQHAAVIADDGDPEDRDEYIAENIFWVPAPARWQYLQDSAKLPEIGQRLDDAMLAIEEDNLRLKGMLPKVYNDPHLDKRRLGQLLDLFVGLKIGGAEERARDVLGNVYEYFLGEFARSEGKKGGEFYTPQPIVKLLVEMLAPWKGRIYDPCCGGGGMFVQSSKFLQSHAGRIDEISIFGQESNPSTWRLAHMNLAIRGLSGNLGKEPADSFHNDQHPALKADYIIANPPFNISDWGGELLRDDIRWQQGMPPVGNANFAWVQHIIHHLSPTGTAGFVLANGSLSSNTNGEGEIRAELVRKNLVDCIVALPTQLFLTTQIPACLWFLARDRTNHRLRRRTGELLFIDARKMGAMTTRTQRILTDDDIARIANTYHAWRGDPPLPDEDPLPPYQDIPGFCKAAYHSEIEANGWVLTPGRYVGAEDIEEDSVAFAEKMAELTTRLELQMVEGARLDSSISKQLMLIRTIE